MCAAMVLLQDDDILGTALKAAGWQEGSRLPKLQIYGHGVLVGHEHSLHRAGSLHVSIPHALRPAASGDSASEAHDTVSIFKQLAGKYCAENFLEKLASPGLSERRGSLHGHSDCRAHVDPITRADVAFLGYWFPFMNREEQCKQLIRHLASLDKLRGKPWDIAKRNAHVPVCAGMSGIGKTRFARSAVEHVAYLASLSFAVDDEAVAVVKYVWDDETDHTAERINLVRQLLLACRQHRSLRLEFQGLAFDGRDEEHAVRTLAASILAQWVKYQFRPASLSRADRDAHAERFFYALATALMKVKVDLAKVLQFISNPLGETAAEDDCLPAIIIHVDEAHVLRTHLQGVIDALMKSLVECKVRVFLIITGMQTTELHESITDSSAMPAEIVLPLLKEQHMQQILRVLFNKPPELELSAHVKDSLWWLGGVPRFLEKLLCCASRQAAISKDEPLESLWRWIESADEAQWQAAVGDALNSLYGTLIPQANTRSTPVPPQVLAGLSALALSGWQVGLHTPLHPNREWKLWTVQYAQNQKLCYWSGQRAGQGHIVIPPIILWDLQHKQAGEVPSVHHLRNPAPISTPSDNEALAITLMLYRLQAAKLLNRDTIQLSELLGLALPGGLEDSILAIPKCLRLNSSSERCSGAELQSRFDSIQKGLREHPECTPCAFINGKGAAAADAFLVLKDLVLHIQEKQHVIARACTAHGCLPAPIPSGNVAAEYRKALQDITAKSVFLYTTDERAPDGHEARGPEEASLPVNCIVAPYSEHERLLGPLLARLRLMHQSL